MPQITVEDIKLENTPTLNVNVPAWFENAEFLAWLNNLALQQ